MTDRRLDVPVAIVLAGALVGAGLFFGLRERGGEPPPLALPSVAVPAQARALVTPPSPAALVEQAKRALDAQRAALVEKCWVPAIKAQPAPAEITYVLDFTFDAQGRQLARGIVENRPTARPPVTRCVTETLVPIEIPPPGAPVHIEVPFRLP